ncbi:hypothetical protein GCM10027188_09950 [Lysobacter humi (ex Lee et al. 2017)]
MRPLNLYALSIVLFSTATLARAHPPSSSDASPAPAARVAPCPSPAASTKAGVEVAPHGTRGTGADGAVPPPSSSAAGIFAGRKGYDKYKEMATERTAANPQPAQSDRGCSPPAS